ncbi:MAG: hypothetical protein U5K81_04935 [Trueperaceae bacterium]|nr:hypothetical protein [Trueperaceae bacterium]
MTHRLDVVRRRLADGGHVGTPHQCARQRLGRAGRAAVDEHGQGALPARPVGDLVARDDLAPSGTGLAREHGDEGGAPFDLQGPGHPVATPRLDPRPLSDEPQHQAQLGHRAPGVATHVQNERARPLVAEAGHLGVHLRGRAGAQVGQAHVRDRRRFVQPPLDRRRTDLRRGRAVLPGIVTGVLLGQGHRLLLFLRYLRRPTVTTEPAGVIVAKVGEGAPHDGVEPGSPGRLACGLAVPRAPRLPIDVTGIPVQRLHPVRHQ